MLERGKVNKIQIDLRRLLGFAGDVHVTAAGLPAGIEAKPLTIPSGKNSGEMEWRVAADYTGAPFPLKLSGAAEINGKTLLQPAVVAQPMLGDGPGFVQIAETTAWASVTDRVQFALDRVPPPGAGFALDRHLLAMRGDRKARVLLRIERAGDATPPIEFAPEGLPEGVVVESQKLAEDGKALDMVLKATADNVPAGEYRITVVGSIKSAGETITESTKAFYLRVEK
jgi:hypothetical protein